MLTANANIGQSQFVSVGRNPIYVMKLVAIRLGLMADDYASIAYDHICADVCSVKLGGRVDVIALVIRGKSERAKKRPSVTLMLRNDDKNRPAVTRFGTKQFG